MAENTSNNLIYGKNPILEALLKNPKRINKIYIQKDLFFDSKMKKINALAIENKIPIQKTLLNKFQEQFEDKPNFQGVVASVSSIEYVELEDFLNKEKNDFKRIVILDGVSDPHNFGAIIRTVAAAGFDAVMISNHRSVSVTPVVEKISSGAVNHIPIIKTTSLSASIDILKKHDFWVIATQMEAKENYYEIDYTDMNFAVVMGSEGSGISKTILNKADWQVKLECHFESLNVSTATAVILYEALRQIRVKKSLSRK